MLPTRLPVADEAKQAKVKAANRGSESWQMAPSEGWNISSMLFCVDE
jgi:hypothetical protein